MRPVQERAQSPHSPASADPGLAIAHAGARSSPGPLVHGRASAAQVVGPVTLEPPTGNIAPDVAAFLSQGPAAVYVSM